MHRVCYQEENYMTLTTGQSPSKDYPYNLLTYEPVGVPTASPMGGQVQCGRVNGAKAGVRVQQRGSVFK